LTNTGPASFDTFVERECGSSSTCSSSRCNRRSLERRALAVRHGRTCTRSPCRGCRCLVTRSRVPCLRYQPCQAAAEGSAYGSCCAHDSSCVRRRKRTESACHMLIRIRLVRASVVRQGPCTRRMIVVELPQYRNGHTSGCTRTQEGLRLQISDFQLSRKFEMFTARNISNFREKVKVGNRRLYVET
jgi:hypothetical protein